MSDLTTIATTLRRLRQSRKLTAKEVAEALATKDIYISEKTLLGYENCVSTPKVNTFLRLCEIYRVTDILGTFGYDINEYSSPIRDTLLANFDQLNPEGQERLVDTSDDMVTSGKYAIINLPSIVQIAAKGGDGVQSISLTSQQAKAAKKAIEELPD